jgi:hypothetical protein
MRPEGEKTVSDAPICCPYCKHPLTDKDQAAIARALGSKGGRAGAGSLAKKASARKAIAARWEKYRAQKANKKP